MTTSDLEYNYLRGIAGNPVPVPHIHAEGDITNLLSDLASKGAANHTHSESDIAGLVNALLGKVDVGHTHPESEIGNLVTDLSGKAPLAHGHAESEISNLSADLSALTSNVNGRAASVHSHAEGDISNLTSDLSGINSSLAGKAATVHSHSESDVINLVSALAGLAPKFQAGTVTAMAAIDPTTQPPNAIFVVNNDPTWQYAIYAAMGSPQVWTMVAALPITMHEIASTAIIGSFDATTAGMATPVGSGLTFTTPGYDFRIEADIPSIGVGTANARGMCSLFDGATLITSCLVPYPGSTDSTKGAHGRILTDPISVASGVSKTYQLASVRSVENTTKNTVANASVNISGVITTIPIRMRAVPV